MTLDVISAGFGRTGTMSLRMALNALDLGPCYHMEDVLHDMPRRVPQWNAALEGSPDWDAIYYGFGSAVDWPTASFWQDLAAHYPKAKFILSSRSSESWFNSISQTILAVLSAPDKWPGEQRAWLEMVHELVVNRCFDGDIGKSNVIAAFERHEALVKSTLPADRLLVHEARDGWAPLCAFLGKPVPADPYPRSNTREEFFEIMSQNSGD